MTTEQEKMAFFQSPQGLVPRQNNIVIYLFIPNFNYTKLLKSSVAVNEVSVLSPFFSTKNY